MENIQRFNLLSFLGDYNVQIPILQRDYAQGRHKQSGIRQNFLNAIYDFLRDENLQTKNLDFIYGYQDNNIFSPIDGQQRITTLWLLHVYLSSKLEDKSSYVNLKNFSYATRKNAKDFCKKLINLKMLDAPSHQLTQDPKITQHVTSGDPTVIAMVTMLDDIHKKFHDCDIQKFLERLNLVTFYVVNMGEYDLGEELYIKMNARGKQLSSFENFKSWLQQDQDIKEDSDLLASIDNNWINHFWKKEQKNLENNQNNWEQELIMMLNYLGMFFVLQSENILKLENIKHFIGNHLSENFDIFNEKNFIYDNERIFTLSRLQQSDIIIKFIMAMDEKGFALPNSKERKTILLPKLFAIFMFAIDKNDINTYQDWDNITNHVIYNTRPRDNEEHIYRMFQLLRELSPSCSNIIEFLASDKELSSGYSKDRISEEKIKAKLMLSDGRYGKWEKLIDSVQHNSYFNGWIDFILEYSKQADYNYSILESSQQADYGYSIELFKKYGETLAALFSIEFLEKKLVLIQRALLSFGDYSILSTNFYFGKYTLDLQDGKEQWSKIFKQSPTLFKEFLEDLSEKDISSQIKLEQSLCSIIDANLKKDWDIRCWWRKLLVEDEDYLNYCREKRIWRNVDLNVIYLVPASKLYKNGRNLLSYALWKYLRKNLENVEISDYDNNASENKNIFTVSTIKIETTEWTNEIKVKKYGAGSKTFAFYTTISDYNALEEFFEEILDYINSI